MRNTENRPKNYYIEYELDKEWLKSRRESGTISEASYYLCLRTHERIKALSTPINPMTAAKLIQKSGIDRNTNNKIINGSNVNLTLNNLVSLAEALQTTPDYLLGYSDIAQYKKSIKVASDTTGLKQSAVDFLNSHFNTADGTEELDIFSDLITSTFFYKFLQRLVEYKRCLYNKFDLDKVLKSDPGKVFKYSFEQFIKDEFGDPKIIVAVRKKQLLDSFEKILDDVLYIE